VNLRWDLSLHEQADILKRLKQTFGSRAEGATWLNQPNVTLRMRCPVDCPYGEIIAALNKIKNPHPV
jgi:uncharacterized protein (DUF2384 family)